MDIFVALKKPNVFIDIEFKSLTFIILLVLGASTFIQLFIYWWYFSRLSFFKKQGPANTNPHLPPVSIIICARNEYTNLEKHLPLILGQDYPDFEVVVVNDCSDDGSDELLADMAREDSRLKIVHLRQSLNFFQGKKFPLSMGIKSAKNEVLLLTDADCKPVSDQWIKTFSMKYDRNTEIVIGYSPYEKRAGLLNFLIQFDTMHIGMQYLSLAIAGKPYMGVGRNLSYKKSLFIKNKGFTSHYNIPSGDDDLFISMVANKNNTSVEIATEALVESMPKTQLSSWTQQKRRHLSTGKYYKKGIKFFLGIYSLSQLLFYASFVWLLFLPIMYFIPLGVFLFRYINQLIIFYNCCKQLGTKFPIALTPFAELFFIIFNPMLVAINSVVKPAKWM
ncbi:MAG: transmembrane glycosyltransferase [Bacteroidetes bacterium HGW-Bacteroidetes-1]|jgi:cellulose synthase/poly-beta-1,6-N-acetylglucosamine synthase-like glycosyltransferase|nr:MAG: transmembrane glycosyltransferase [Bacteroidetes bacterium HGW-Bacteroidetes-1]